MPYFRRYYYRRNYWRPRRRRIFRRRFRTTFQRRRWHRRRRRVRTRKLKKLKLDQWQPHYIKRLKVIGHYPLFLATSARLTNNLNCYLESIAPEKWPGGGGFSVNNFSLNTLYQENLIVKNWWTTSNDNMPLIRYLGCTITLYRQENFDYIFTYNNQPPMQATKLTYMSSHPQVQLLHKNKIVMKCQSNNPRKKPYKKVRIKPPPQMLNKWYFQKELAFTPLVQTITTAASLDRMFLHSNAQSSTIGFRSLNTTEFRNHMFEISTQGYYPLLGEKLFAVHANSIAQAKASQLIFLGNPKEYTEGTELGQIPNGTNLSTKWDKLRSNHGYWGNPFHPFYLDGDFLVLKTQRSWDELKTTYSSDKQLQASDFQLKTNTVLHCRYNPFRDKGIGNQVYLLKTTSGQTHADSWEPHTDPDIIWENLPLWLLLWGYLDFQKKCGTISQIDNTSVLVIKTKYIDPPSNNIYVPLDDNFFTGHSPYETELLFPSDRQTFHPKVRMQVKEINNIGTTGPATIKLPENISCEGHCKYCFYFKIGGQPAPMSEIVDPDKQPQYNIPYNILQQPSLQSPTTPFEYMLWNFDERRGQLTKKAAQRITTYTEPEKDIFSITESTTTCPTASQQRKETSDEETSEEETDPKTQLLLERRKQKLLRQRINRLLNKLTILE
nr:MAG: ORF1 [TTV-like mini virus]